MIIIHELGIPFLTNQYFMDHIITDSMHITILLVIFP